MTKIQESIMATPKQIKPMQSHKNLFHEVNQINRGLTGYVRSGDTQTVADLYAGTRPSTAADFDLISTATISFGALMEKLAGIAKTYGCEVNPPDAETAELQLSGKDVYCICMDIVRTGTMRCKTLVELKGLKPIIHELIKITEAHAKFEHPAPAIDSNLEYTFSRGAKLTVRSVYSRIDILDEDQISKRAAAVLPKLRDTFKDIPGRFNDQCLDVAADISGSVWGLNQAEKGMAPEDRVPR
jgi:hypothetical protein